MIARSLHGRATVARLTPSGRPPCPTSPVQAMDLEVTPEGMRELGLALARAYGDGSCGAGGPAALPDGGALILPRCRLSSPDAEYQLAEYVAHPVLQGVLSSLNRHACYVCRSGHRLDCTDAHVYMGPGLPAVRVTISCVAGLPPRVEAWIVDWERFAKGERLSGVVYACSNAREPQILRCWAAMVWCCARRPAGRRVGCLAALLSEDTLRRVVAAGMAGCVPRVVEAGFPGGGGGDGSPVREFLEGRASSLTGRPLVASKPKEVSF